MRAADIIDRKRRGHRLTRDEIYWFVRGCLTGEVADYQAAAWLMAVAIRGMDPEETWDLTEAMASSGERLKWPARWGRVLDKHSTGGVADTATLVVVPLVASLGIPMVKLSGRGLGHTGGTIDKLEAIPGLQTALSPQEICRILEAAGMVIAGQSASLAPADGHLYALRDVTATVDSIPLIAASIMAKKLAANAAGLVLDVKSGSGAILPDL
ncbi:MAG TPA: thymidine phosphorylase, partial [Clostridiales bacterium UBA8153]|nr:thymidine phosphorylase [Clostridiales bacterium UBA8153]